MKSVRIAGGLGFYGDSWRPIKASIERGNVQYVASDHLAELTLAILQKDRQRDPNLGYTRDFAPMLLDLLPIAIPRGVKFIINAGGLNPMAAREVLLGALKKFGIKLKVGVVLGDSVLERLDELQEVGVSLAHMDTGADITTVRDRLLFASAYLGARPLMEALDAGADIVLTGRVADAALFLAPMIHELGWSRDDWDKLAQGIVVGHLLECSGQALGKRAGLVTAGIGGDAELAAKVLDVSREVRDANMAPLWCHCKAMMAQRGVRPALGVAGPKRSPASSHRR